MIKKAFIAWLPIGVAICGLAGLVYLAVQQDLRQGANDPQIQMSEDAADLLASGQVPQSVLPKNQVNIASSLEPFMIIYDQSGQLIDSSGKLDGMVPSLPAHVFTDAWHSPELRFTWQPQSGVREATVVTPFYQTNQHLPGQIKGFVLVGRSLREVEMRELELEFEVGVVLLSTLGLSFLSVLFFSRKA